MGKVNCVLKSKVATAISTIIGKVLTITMVLLKIICQTDIVCRLWKIEWSDLNGVKLYITSIIITIIIIVLIDLIYQLVNNVNIRQKIQGHCKSYYIRRKNNIINSNIFQIKRKEQQAQNLSALALSESNEMGDKIFAEVNQSFISNYKVLKTNNIKDIDKVRFCEMYDKSNLIQERQIKWLEVLKILSFD